MSLKGITVYDDDDDDDDDDNLLFHTKNMHNLHVYINYTLSI